MKKKVSFFLLIIIISQIFFLSCTFKRQDLPYSTKKPSTYYYSDELFNKLTKEEYFLKVFLIKFNKQITIENNEDNEKDLNGFLDFFYNIDKNNFVDSPTLPEFPKYKIFVEFSNCTYVINVFDDTYASVHPFDDIYTPDYIDMTNVPLTFNLEEFCDYIMNKPQEVEKN